MIRFSTITRAPASPNRRASSMSRAAARASTASAATTTPFPAASPSALTTTEPRRSIAASASATVVTTENGAVGMRWRAKNSLLNALLPSSCAPCAPGPNVGSPFARSLSASPATSGASGPTTTRSTPSSRASSTSFACSSTLTAMQRASPSIPGLPGAAITSCPLSVRRYTSACSRPPLPTTRIFMRGI